MSPGQVILFFVLVSMVVLSIVLPATLVKPGVDTGDPGQDMGNGSYSVMVPAGPCNPNPPPGPSDGYAQVRTWSNTIYNQIHDTPDARGMSTFAWAWGQVNFIYRF